MSGEESLIRGLPMVVRSEFAKMDANEQAQFISEFKRKRKSLVIAYMASLLSLHYAYVGKWSTTFLMLFVGAITLGIGLVIWWGIDLFRMPGIIRDGNSDTAISVLRDQRIISGHR